MKRFRTLLITGVAVLAAGLAWAQGTSEGEVAKLDKAQGRITIKHGGVKNLDMPPMAMAFKVRDPKMLDSVAVGDKVRFAAEKVEGSFTVTSLSRAN